MDTPAPLASKFFYALAFVAALAAFIIFLIAVFGGEWADIIDSYVIAVLRGPLGIIYSIEVLIAAGGFAAVGAVIHDIRRIAVNTSHESLSGLLAVAKARNADPIRAGRRKCDPVPANVTYFYFVDDKEWGPVSERTIRELLRTNKIPPYSKIERSVDGMREAFDVREFDT